MTEKKTSPIAKHKEADARKVRELNLEIMDATGEIKCPHCQKTFFHKLVNVKEKIEAGKLLTRMHHLLQVDKTIVKAGAIAGAQAQSLPPDEMKKIQAEVEEILGRERTAEITTTLL